VFFRRPQGKRETKKRQTPVKLHERLLAHLRRYHADKPETGQRKARAGQRFAVEWNGNPVLDVDKAFRRVVQDAGVGSDVTPHTLRHTAATWLMQRGTDIGEAASYLGMTVETLERVYWHHHPDFQAQAAANIVAKPALRPGPTVPENIVRFATRG
jgi:integrase